MRFPNARTPAPVPGAGIPGRDIPFLDQVQNLPAWLDRELFACHLYDGTSDPEGILHASPAIATTLIGVLTGHWLKSNRKAAHLIGGMTFFGILGVLGGELWNRWFPINKHMWTSSFVQFSGGFCLLFLSVLYWATEVRRWRGRWTIPILVFGMNAIAGFVADSLIYGPGYIVDDFEEWRHTIRILLQARPEWQIVGEACDGIEAVSKAAEARPDVIVLDIGLPRLNRIQAARLIRERSPRSKVVFLTQEPSEHIKTGALATGTLGYVLEANAASELLPAIDAALKR